VGILYTVVVAILGGIAVGVMEVMGIGIPDVPTPPTGP
jgi:hypothetical protein